MNILHVFHTDTECLDIEKSTSQIKKRAARKQWSGKCLTSNEEIKYAEGQRTGPGVNSSEHKSDKVQIK